MTVKKIKKTPICLKISALIATNQLTGIYTASVSYSGMTSMKIYTSPHSICFTTQEIPLHLYLFIFDLIGNTNCGYPVIKNSKEINEVDCVVKTASPFSKNNFLPFSPYHLEK